MISQEELDTMLTLMEEDRIEKTISVNDNEKFGEAICSFANDLPMHNKPGYLIVGVNNDGSRCGLKVGEKLIQTLMDFRTDGRVVPPPSMIVSKFTYPDGDVAVVEVQPHFQPPIRFKGKVCIRIGPRKGIANEAEERRLSEKRSSFARTFDTMPSYNSSLEDLKTDIFTLSYLPKAVDAETLKANNRTLKEQLASLKFYDFKGDCPTNAGIIMFGKDPKYFLPGAYIQYVRFKGPDITSDFEFEHRFKTDLATEMQVINLFIESQIIKKVLPEIGGQYRHSYPLAAIKELLYNAIIHRDYQSNAPIKFYEFSDHIEISNPGGLYGEARPENFPNRNDYRNPSLAEAARYLGYINQFNVGVTRSILQLKENGNPAPEFDKDKSTHFTVIIYKRSL